MPRTKQRWNRWLDALAAWVMAGIAWERFLDETCLWIVAAQRGAEVRCVLAGMNARLRINARDPDWWLAYTRDEKPL